MNMQLEPDLLSAVDALTKPVKLVRLQDTDHDHEWIELTRPTTTQERDEARRQKPPRKLPPTMPLAGQYRCQWCDTVTSAPRVRNSEQTLRRRTELPLLDQLRDAVASDQGQSGGKKPGREQVPVDIAAIQMYENIDGIIRAWLLELGARPGKEITLTQALRSWYTLWAVSQHVEGIERRKRVTLEGWAVQVRDKLQPPKRIELTAPCPECGFEWINVGLKRADRSDDPEDLEYVRTLTAVERPSLDDSFAVCQKCDTVWLGVGRMRALRIAIDDAEAKAAALVADTREVVTQPIPNEGDRT